MSFLKLSDATGRRPLRIWIFLGVASAALAGCGGGQSRHAAISEPAYIALTEAQAFTYALQQRYLELSTRAFDRGDRGGADFYALRSIMAIEGKAVNLLSPHELGLRGGLAQEAASLRLRLTTVFQDGGRLYAPEDSARAQALYDCWLRETASGGDPGRAAICQGAAETAVARLEAASRGAARLESLHAQEGPVFMAPPSGFAAPIQTAAPLGYAPAGPISGYAPAAAQPPLPYAQYQVLEPYHAERPSPSAPYDAPSYGVQIGAPPPAAAVAGGVALGAPIPTPRPVAPPTPVSTPAPPRGGVLASPPQGLRGSLPAPQPHFESARPAAPVLAESQLHPQPGVLTGRLPAPPSWAGAEAAGYAQAPAAGLPRLAAPPTPTLWTESEPARSAPAPLAAAPAAAPRGEDLRILFPAPMAAPPTAAPPSGLRAQSAPRPTAPLAAAPEPAPSGPLLDSSLPSARVVSPQASGPDAGQAMATAAENRPRGLPVFFEFASDSLTPEAQDILNDLASEARRQEIRRISIAGFTDSAGSSRYNQLLAMRRAQAVRASLERRLGSEVVFEVLPAGKAGQAVATADEVREAANRRVEIALLPN